MLWRWSLLTLLLVGAPGWAQEPFKVAPTVEAPVLIPGDAAASTPPSVSFTPATAAPPPGLLTGNRNFPNFIGFMSNPLQSIDPRAVTEFWPVFDSTWFSPSGKLPSGDVQLYGAGLYVALSERLSVGLNQGGYAVAHADKLRQGWLNLGGFGQYTLIQDVPDQFLLTVGLRWEAPSGEASVFQGHGPAHLAPYLTIGKEFGEFHLLATTGYQFAARTGDSSLDLFYTNLHIDRRVCGWLYPLVEFNWIQHRTSVDLSRGEPRDFFNFGTFEATGNIVTLAAGFNAVLVPQRLELGAVYTTPIASQRGFDFNGVLVKLVCRY
jgi:hypothetical protein